MGTRERLIIIKYNGKNTIINPLIKQKSGIIYLIIMASCLGLLLFTIRGATNSPVESRMGLTFRLFFLSHSLNRFVLSEIVSSVLMAFTLIMLILMPPSLPVSEAEYELVLSQPIEIRDFVLSKEFLRAFQQFALLPYVVSVLIISLMLAPNLPKALLTVLSALMLTTYFALLDISINLVELTLEKRGLRKLFRLACLAYLMVGLAQTALIRNPSPLLAMPLEPLGRALVYPLSTATGIDEILKYIGLSAIPSIVAFAVTYGLARTVDIEDIRPLRLLGAFPKKSKGREKEGIGKRGKILKEIDLNSPDRTAIEVLYYSEVFDPLHLKTFGVALITSVVICLLIRHFLSSEIWSIAGFTINTMIPLITALIFTSIINSVMVRDLTAYWIYRVYLIRMRPVAKALLLKIFTYAMEATVVMGAAIAALTEDPSNLIIIPLISPVAALVSFLSLALISYFASKRKIIRQVQYGMYTIESSAILIVEMLFIGTLMGAPALACFLLMKGPVTALVSAIIALGIPVILLKVMEGTLGRIMERYDIVT